MDMKDVFKRFWVPITAFVSGFIILLALSVFMPSIGAAQDKAISAIPTSQMSAFTGLHDIMSAGRLILWCGLILAFVIVTLFVVWLKRR